MAGDADISTQNMSFKDNVPGHMDSRGTVMDSTRNDGFMTDATLDSFFSRPVKIFETDWAVNSSLFARFNPWELFWENPRNLEKIRNYYLLKCTMHVKLLINGNAFYYGRAILGYEPLSPLDNFSYPKIVRPNAYVNQDLIRLSQRMKIFVNPTESQGGSLELPFFWYNNAFSIPDNEWEDMGDLVLMSINDLKHANGGTEPLSITVLAWAENVSFSIPTSSVPEMGVPEMADEHEENVISRPASTIARYASALSNIPWIGPFAKATEIGAGALASIAKIFGYSSPAELEYSVMVPNPRPSMAVVDTKYPTNKLSVDSKQEITLDPATTGIQPDDELPIASIAGRESYLTTFDWNQSDLRDASLFQIRVDPWLFRTAGSEHHFPACAAAVMPFQYWRGTMRFRFQIVSSNYHKGRIRIAYDPVRGTLNPEYNTHYTTVHDISTEKDFTVDIGWAQKEPYRRPVGTSSNSFTTSRTVPLTNVANRGNGVLSVHVLNDLAVPGSVVADIQVNVYVSMLEDFEVAMPNNSLTSWRFRSQTNPQMGVPEMGYPEMAEGDQTADMDCCDDPVMDPPTIDTMADAIIDSPDTTKLFFGEVIGSFRQMLKRTCLSEVVRLNDDTKSTISTISRRAFPEFGGRLPNSAPTFAGSVALTYSNGEKYVPAATTYINYISQMFLGWRGSIRWTVDTSTLNVSSGNDRFNSVTTILARDNISVRTSTSTELLGTGVPPQNVNVVMMNNEDSMFVNGGFVGNTNVNPVHSVEVPFYANRRFLLTQNQPSYTAVLDEPCFTFSAVLPGSATDDDVSFVRMFCSAGEDLNFFFFNGLPPMFFQPTLPNDS